VSTCATAKQNDHGSATLTEIDAIAGAGIDPKFADPIEELDVTHQAGLQSGNTTSDAASGKRIFQLREPFPKCGSLLNFKDHMRQQ
jgi:hypothetical protein